MSIFAGSGGGVSNGGSIFGGSNNSILYVDSSGALKANDTGFTISPTTHQFDIDYPIDTAHFRIMSEASSSLCGIQFNTLSDPGVSYNIQGGATDTLISAPGAAGVILFCRQDVVFGRMNPTGFLFGSATLTPTHTFTCPSVGTGYRHYNTTDQTTNYEGLDLYWSASEAQVVTSKGGSGTVRGMRIGSPGKGEILCGYGGANIMYFNTNSTSRFYIDTSKLFNYLPVVGDSTHIASGTTGNQTINKPAGSVNFAAAATTLTVTNSMCTTTSIITCVVMTNDTTATIKNVVPASGSFVITLGAAATAETRVGFILG